MCRTGQDGFKSLTSCRFVVQIELQLRHALLAVAQRASGAGDDIGQPHFAAAGDARGFNHAVRAAAKAQQRARLIFILYRQLAAGIFGVGTRFDHRHHVAAHLFDVAHQIVRHIDDMRRQIAQRAEARQRFLAVPVERRLRLRQIIFIVGAVKMHHFADLAAGDNLFCQLAGGVLHIVKAHQGFHPGGLGRLHHLFRIGHRERQRLFRIDMLAVANRLQRHLLMQEVGRADIHHVNRRIAHQLAPVAGRTRKAKGGRLLLRQRRIDLCQHLPHDFAL